MTAHIDFPQSVSPKFHLYVNLSPQGRKPQISLQQPRLVISRSLSSAAGASPGALGRAPAPGGLVPGERGDGGAPAPPILCSQAGFLSLFPVGFLPTEMGQELRGLSSCSALPPALVLSPPPLPLPCLNSCCPVTLSPNITSSKKLSQTPDWIFPPLYCFSAAASQFVISSCGTVESYASPWTLHSGRQDPVSHLHSTWHPVPTPTSAQ